MSQTSAIRDLRMSRFVELYEQWTSRQISQARAAGLLGVSARTFRRYVARYRKLGLQGLEDRRATSSRRAPAEEVAALVTLYEERYLGWGVGEFFRAYRDVHGGTRSHTWVKMRLHDSGLVSPGRSTLSAPDCSDRQPAEGLLLHQASCTSEWLPKRIWELVALVDGASYRVHSGFFVANEAIWYRFRTIHETVATNGLFKAIHVDRALRSHHDCRETGQFPRAMRRLGINVLRLCPEEARNMYKYVFRVLLESLPQQLADAGVQSILEANEFLRSYWGRLNRFVAIEPDQSTAAFDPLLPGYEAEIAEILCLHKSREAGTDNGAGHRETQKVDLD